MWMLLVAGQQGLVTRWWVADSCPTSPLASADSLVGGVRVPKPLGLLHVKPHPGLVPIHRLAELAPGVWLQGQESWSSFQVVGWQGVGVGGGCSS